MESPVVWRAVNQPSPDPKTVNMKKLLPTRKCKHLLSKLSIIQTKQIKGKPKVNFPRQKFSSPFYTLQSEPPEAVFTSIGDTENLNSFSLIGGQGGEKWMEARDKEICSLEKKHCWVAVDLPPNTPSVGSKYICTQTEPRRVHCQVQGATCRARLHTRRNQLL
jgi:hypothetical protein